MHVPNEIWFNFRNLKLHPCKNRFNDVLDTLPPPYHDPYLQLFFFIRLVVRICIIVGLQRWTGSYAGRGGNKTLAIATFQEDYPWWTGRRLRFVIKQEVLRRGRERMESWRCIIWRMKMKSLFICAYLVEEKKPQLPFVTRRSLVQISLL